MTSPNGYKCQGSLTRTKYGNIAQQFEDIYASDKEMFTPERALSVLREVLKFDPNQRARDPEALKRYNDLRRQRAQEQNTSTFVLYNKKYYENKKKKSTI